MGTRTEFSYSSDSFNINDKNPIPTVADSSGKFTATNNLVIDAALGRINLLLSGVGIYEVTYTIDDDSSSKQVEITN